MNGDAHLHAKLIHVHERRHGTLRVDELALLNGFLQHQGVKRGSDDRSLQIQLRLPKPTLGRLQRHVLFFEMRSTEGQLLTERADVPRRFQQIPLALGHRLIAKLNLQIKLGFGQGGPLLIHGELIITRVDPQQRLIVFEYAADDKFGIQLHHAPADFRLHDQPPMRLHGSIRGDDGSLILHAGGEHVDQGRLERSVGFRDGRTAENQELGSDHGQPQDEQRQADPQQRGFGPGRERQAGH